MSFIIWSDNFEHEVQFESLELYNDKTFFNHYWLFDLNNI